MQYKSCRMINGKAKWVIVNGHREIINRNPNTDEIKSLEIDYIPDYHPNRCNIEICDECKKERLVPGKALKEYDEEEEWTGRWLCVKCWYHIDYKNRENTQAKIIKMLSARRIGNINKEHTNYKGDLFQELTCRWRSTVSTIPVEDLNKRLDNYITPIDHTYDSELGIIQTKGRFLGISTI